MSECSKNAELGDADVDVNIDPVCYEDPTYPDSECEYYIAFYLCTISEHVFRNIFIVTMCYLLYEKACNLFNVSSMKIYSKKF